MTFGGQIIGQSEMGKQRSACILSLRTSIRNTIYIISRRSKLLDFQEQKISPGTYQIHTAPLPFPYGSFTTCICHWPRQAALLTSPSLLCGAAGLRVSPTLQRALTSGAVGLSQSVTSHVRQHCGPRPACHAPPKTALRASPT